MVVYTAILPNPESYRFSERHRLKIVTLQPSFCQELVEAIADANNIRPMVQISHI